MNTNNQPDNYTSYCSNFKYQYTTTKRITSSHSTFSISSDVEITVLRYDFRVRKILDINVLHVISHI